MKGLSVLGISLFLLVKCASTQAVLAYDFSVWDWSCQCHGDADGQQNGMWRVSTIDAEIIRAAYPSAYPDGHYNPAADIDRNFKIDEADGDIASAWIGKLNVPADCAKKLEFTGDDAQCVLANAVQTINWTWRQNFANPTPEDHPGTFSLCYSTNGGQTWQDIATVSQQTSYDWLVPQDLSGSVMLKIADTVHIGLADIVSVNVCQCLVNMDGDFNSDCYIDLLDMAVIGKYWLGDCSADDNWCGGADFDTSSTVDFVDLLTFVQNWTLCANPCDENCPQAQ